MKKYFLFSLFGLHLLACSKDSSEPVPATVTTAFGHEFDLRYQQQALLPALQSPELTVKLVDLQYAFCPKNTICFLPDRVFPTLDIYDAQQQTQQVKLALQLSNQPNWIDSARVQANGRRYVVYFTKWHIDGTPNSPQKKDLVITLRVAK